MSRTPPAWPRRDGAGGASAPTNRSPSGPPSRVGAKPQRARVRRPSKPPLWGQSTGHRRTAASQAARATAPEAQGAARSVRCRCADASHPGPRGHMRCSGPAVAQSSAGQSSSPRRHPRSCAPAPTARSPGSAASRSDRAPTGSPLPDPPRSDEQQPAPCFASATHGAPAYPRPINTGILNPSPSPGIGMIPLVGASRTSDVLLVQLIPTDHTGLPVTKSEIDKRLGQITFNAPLQKELEAIGMMKTLLHKEGQPTSRLGRKIQSLQLHHLSAEDYVDDLSQASVLDTKWDFLTHLRDRGRAAAEACLSSEAGVRS